MKGHFVLPDGSKIIKINEAGSGMYGVHPKLELIASQDALCTVSQAEINEIELFFKKIKAQGYKRRCTYILSDNKTAILATPTRIQKIMSKLVARLPKRIKNNILDRKSGRTLKDVD